MVSNQSEVSSNDFGSSHYEELPPIPEGCEEFGGKLANAFYGHETGQVSFAQRNQADRKFQSCLKDSGFSDVQISNAVAAVKEDALN